MARTAVAQLPAAVGIDPRSGHLQHLEAALAASLALSSPGRLQYLSECCRKAGLLRTLWGYANPVVEARLAWPVLTQVWQLPRQGQTRCWEVLYLAMASYQPLSLSRSTLEMLQKSMIGTRATLGASKSPKVQ